ncbi:MAG: 50S ribosomal protein L31 [Rickettsiales bacterium]
MKNNIHPSYNEVTLNLPKGDTFKTMSSFKGGKEIHLDVDYRTHPAWTKKGLAGANSNSAQVSKFNKKFGNLFSSKPSASE